MYYYDIYYVIANNCYVCGQLDGVECLTIPLDSATLKDFLEQQEEES